MGAAAGGATAATFLWLGMVLAISFLEAPLKFRAPGVTVPLGLGIGRLVFRALNAVEAVLALVVAVCLAVGRPGSAVLPAVVAIAVLLVQVLAVRPRLSRRSDAVLAGADAGADGGADAPRSHAHFAYIGLEVVKVVALAATGVLLLSS